ncbi:MAG: hypothetical protein U0270_19405 [Labilithrix sp.]
MLRPLLACATASALLLLLAACSQKSADGDVTNPEAPPATESNQTTTEKNPQSTPNDAPDGTETPIDIGNPNPGTTSGDPATPDPGVSDKVDFSDVKITVNGEARHYVLAVPKNYDANKAYPLVIALHGDGGNARGFVTDSKLTAATGDQAIVAFPDQVLDLFTSYYDNNDQRLVAATIIQVKKNRNIDGGKIWGFGHSKGAFMLSEMGCRKPGLFTAFASYAGGAPQEQNDNGEPDCPDAQGLPFLVMAGENDPDFPGIQFQADYWAGIAGCSTSKQSTTQGTAPAACQQYKDCQHPVVFCKVQGFGHAPMYPSAATDTWKWFNSL